MSISLTLVHRAEIAFHEAEPLHPFVGCFCLDVARFAGATPGRLAS
ncbi:MAG TPA: hypothetical protein VIR54_00355 [Vicinamibacterales bacterium]|jgi:hypothetical protein